MLLGGVGEGLGVLFGGGCRGGKGIWGAFVVGGGGGLCRGGKGIWCAFVVGGVVGEGRGFGVREWDLGWGRGVV